MTSVTVGNKRARASLVREVLDSSRLDAAPGDTVLRADDICRLLAPDMRGAQQEAFVVVFLNARHRVTGTQLVSLGTLDASIVHPRDVFRAAILQSAAAVIVAHNHLSGDPEPSPEDIALTRCLAEAGRVVGVPVLDHVIIGAAGRVSLAERGILQS